MTLLSDKKVRTYSNEGGGAFYKAICFFVFVGVFFLPFDMSVPYITAFGEFSSLMSFYIFFVSAFAALPYFISSTQQKVIPKECLVFMILMPVVLVCSLIINADNIFTVVFKGRSGLNKAITTIFAYSFSLFILFLVAKISQKPGGIQRYIVRPTMLVYTFMVLPVVLIEVASWYNDSFFSTFVYIRRFVSLWHETPYPGRLHGVSGEPSFFALHLCFAMICLWFSFVNAKKRKIRFIYSILFLSSIIFTFMSGARTAYLILLGVAFLYVVQNILLNGKDPGIYKTKLRYLLLSIIWGISFILVGHNNMLADYVVQGNSVSNLSRYASNYTAYEIFFDHILLGVGFGQYAFHAVQYFPSWAWESWEIRNWFSNAPTVWPSVFSTQARLFAETGVLGFMAWHVPLFYMFARLIHVARTEQFRLQRKPVLGLFLIYGMVYFFLYGVAQEGFRQLGGFIFLGMASAYLTVRYPETQLLLAINNTSSTGGNLK